MPEAARGRMVKADVSANAVLGQVPGMNPVVVFDRQFS